VSDIDGNNATQLTNGAAPWSPVFSGDGTFVYYRSESSIWRVASSGGKAERLTIDAENDRNLDISPDGHWLLFRMNNRGNHRIRLYPLSAGGTLRVFSVPRTPSSMYARFHPSSRAFGFVDWSGDAIPNIWLQNIDGGPPRQITHFDRGDIYAFDWSPDGKWLAVSYGEPKTDVVIVRDFR